MEHLEQFLRGNVALVIVDLQKGIVARQAQPYASAQVIENARKLLEAFKAKNRPVIFVHVAFSSDWGDALRPLADAPMQFPKPPDDWSEIVPELNARPDDLLVTKRQWGAFYGTDLELQLRRRGITGLVMCGISTELGVESTARDAYERNYALLFVEDAMSATRDAGDHHHACSRLFPLMGMVRTTAQVLEAIG